MSPVKNTNSQTLLGQAQGDLRDAIEISVTVERMRTADPARSASTLRDAIEAAEKGVDKMRIQLRNLEERHGEAGIAGIR